MKERSSLEVGELLTTAWKDYRENLWFFLSIVAIIFGSRIFVNALESATGGGTVAMIVGFAIDVIVGASVAHVMLRFIDGKPVRFSYVIPPVQSVAWYALFEVIIAAFFAICAFIAVYAIAFGFDITIEAIFRNQMALRDIFTISGRGFVFVVFVFTLLFAIAIAFITRFAFTTSIIVDRGFATFKAMRASNLLTKDVQWRIIFLIFVIVLINMIGAMAMMVGLIVTIPVTMIMFFRAYRALYENLALRTQGDNKGSDDGESQEQRKGDGQGEEEQKERVQSEYVTEGEDMSREDETKKVMDKNGGNQSTCKSGAKDA